MPRGPVSYVATHSTPYTWQSDHCEHGECQEDTHRGAAPGNVAVTSLFAWSMDIGNGVIRSRRREFGKSMRASGSGRPSGHPGGVALRARSVPHCA
jgi:hypothetical protein